MSKDWLMIRVRGYKICYIDKSGTITVFQAINFINYYHLMQNIVLMRTLSNKYTIHLMVRQMWRQISYHYDYYIIQRELQIGNQVGNGITKDKISWIFSIGILIFINNASHMLWCEKLFNRICEGWTYRTRPACF